MTKCPWGAMKVLCLTAGGLLRVKGFTEAGAIWFDRVAGVSRRHSRVSSTPEGLNTIERMNGMKYYPVSVDPQTQTFQRKANR